MCTTNGKPPREDQQNVLLGLRAQNWTCNAETTLFYRLDQIKEANAISLAMRPCFATFPLKDDSPCRPSEPIW